MYTTNKRPQKWGFFSVAGSQLHYTTVRVCQGLAYLFTRIVIGYETGVTMLGLAEWGDQCNGPLWLEV